MSKLTYLSALPLDQRGELELLVFFNSCQRRARSGIVRALELYGRPEIVDGPQGLVVTVSGRPDAQCLFATARSRRRTVLAGMVIFLRTGLTEVSIIHLAVADRYQRWRCVPVAITLGLLERVRAAARRLRGVAHIRVLYADAADGLR